MYAYILMPFDNSFNDIYKFGIKEITKKLSITAERLDEQIFANDMLDRIYTEIDKADFIIADMSTRNPNVFYEVGYADAKKKLVILLTNNTDDIPFDFLHRPHIIYSNIEQLRDELYKKCEWVLNELEMQKKEPLLPSINILSSDIERNSYSDTRKIKIRLEIHNRTDLAVDKINSIYIYTGKGWSILYNKENCQKTESDIDPFFNRHILHPNFNTIPGNDWLPIDIELQKTLYTKWDTESVKKDDYTLEGLIKLSINTDKNKYIFEHKLKAELKYFDIPF